jgi:hypothetical protein
MGKLNRLELYSMRHYLPRRRHDQMLTRARIRLQILQGTSRIVLRRLFLHVHHWTQWLRQVQLVSG